MYTNQSINSFDHQGSTQLYTVTFPWKATHSGAQPPVETVVGAIVVLTKLLLLLQIEGNSIPQFMSFQYPVCAEFILENVIHCC